MKQSWGNKNVVITGAARGLGAALCKRYLKAGANVIGGDLNMATLDHKLFTAMTCDVTDEKSVDKVFETILKKFGGVDLLINNAGITNIKYFQRNTNEEIRKVMDVNFFGSVYCTRSSWDSILERNGGIIAISSIAGIAPLIGRTAYSASKHALHGFFESLRAEHSDDDINIMMVCPSFIDTGLRKHMYKEDQSNENTGHVVGGNDSPDQVADLIFKGYNAKKKTLVTGRIGHISALLRKFLPDTYEKMMIKNLKAELANEH